MNTKLIIFISILLNLYHIPLCAQAETKTDTIGIKTDSSIMYLTPLEYAFMMHEETSRMFKVNLIVVDPEENVGLKFVYERRIAPSFTLNGVIQYVGRERGVTNAFMGALEARWYYNMAKLVYEKRSKRNLSGNYFSLGSSYWFLIDRPYENSSYQNNNNFISLFGKYGVQRRFLNSGYIDLGIKSGFDFFPNLEHTSTFFIYTYLDAGFAYAKDKQNLERDRLCSVLRCYATDRFLLKVNLINIFSFFVYNEFNENDSFSFRFNPNIAAEIKFGKSPFSANAELYLRNRVEFDITKQNSTDYTYYMIEPGFSLEGRWYYNLNKRIINGKSGNGLSANYIGLGSRFTYSSTTIERFKPHENMIPPGTTLPYHHYSTEMFYYVNTGIQRLLSDHIYIDVNIKFGYVIKNNQQTDHDDYQYEFPEVYIGMAVGYRF